MLSDVFGYNKFEHVTASTQFAAGSQTSPLKSMVIFGSSWRLRRLGFL